MIIQITLVYQIAITIFLKKKGKFFKFWLEYKSYLNKDKLLVNDLLFLLFMAYTNFKKIYISVIGCVCPNPGLE